MNSRVVGGTPLSVLTSVHPHWSFSQALPVLKRWTVHLETRHYYYVPYRLKDRPHKCEVEQGVMGLPFTLLQVIQTSRR